MKCFIPRKETNWDFTAFVYFDEDSSYGVSFNGVVHYIEPAIRHITVLSSPDVLEVSFEAALDRLLSKYRKL